MPPARNDIFAAYDRLLLNAGCATTVRGYYFPEETMLPGSSFPVGAYFEEQIENLEVQEPAGYHRSGLIRTFLFVETGVAASDSLGGGQARYKKLDDLSDSILREFGRDALTQAPPIYVWNGTTFYAEGFIPWYWYQGGPNLSIVGGELRTRFQQNFN